MNSRSIPTLSRDHLSYSKVESSGLKWKVLNVMSQSLYRRSDKRPIKNYP